MICDNDIARAGAVARFLALFCNRFTIEVGSVAKQQYEIQSSAAKQEIPVMQDVVKLNELILSQMSFAKAALEKDFSVAAVTC